MRKWTFIVPLCFISVMETEEEKMPITSELRSNYEEPTKGKEWLTTLKGIAVTLCYIILGTASKTCLQALDRSIPDFELNAIRCGFSAVFMGSYFAARRKFPRIAETNFKLLVFFTILTNLKTLASCTSVTFVPMASAECTYVTAMVLSGMVIYTFCNGERFKVGSTSWRLRSVYSESSWLFSLSLFFNHLKMTQLQLRKQKGKNTLQIFHGTTYRALHGIFPSMYHGTRGKITYFQF